MRRSLAGLLLVFATATRAGVGVTELPATGDAPPVTVFYPTAAADQRVVRGPFVLRLAPGATPLRGNGRLVVVSHGSGGGPWVHSDIARALVKAGFVVAMPLHEGDNWSDMSAQGPQSWALRPAEVSRAIDAVGADARFAPLLALEKVGVFGQSAGGHTALSLAGGRWSPARFQRHCAAHIEEDFPACVGTYTRLTGGSLDGIKRALAKAVLRVRFHDETPQAHHDARIAAVVAGVPAAADFDTATLAQPRVPLGLVTAGADIWLKPRFHSDRVLAACLPRCELLASLPEGGHSILLSPAPPADVLGEAARELLADPPGFDRAVLPDVDQRIAAFFRTHLLP